VFLVVSVSVPRLCVRVLVLCPRMMSYGYVVRPGSPPSPNDKLRLSGGSAINQLVIFYVANAAV